MKASIRTNVPRFNTNRMLREYTEKMYLPAQQRVRKVTADGFALTRSLSEWKERLRRNWNQVRIAAVDAVSQEVLKVGDAMPVKVRVGLGTIPPEDVAVEAYYGPLTPDGEIRGGRAVRLGFVSAGENGEHVFAGAVPCETSGRNGYAVRVVPCHDDLADRYDQGLVVWG
jgi:starch phosphorylase